MSDKKWYNLFVSVDEAAGQTVDSSADRPETNAARAVADIAASIAPAPKFTATVSEAATFGEIYSAAEIRPPAHGYSIMKISEMLQSEHIRNLPREVKRSSVLVALEAAGAPLQEVIEDAVKRDRALDTFERVQEQALASLETSKTKENQEIQAEMDRMVAEHRSRMQANNDEVAKEKERFFGWRLKKQEEEQRIADAVSYFVTENPITTRGPAVAPRPSPTEQK